MLNSGELLYDRVLIPRDSSLWVGCSKFGLPLLLVKAFRSKLVYIVVAAKRSRYCLSLLTDGLEMNIL